MKDKEFDVVIVGAGPAGCACAYQLSGKGLKVIIKTSANTDEYKVMEESVSKRFFDDTGFMRDNRCKDIARIQFLSYDPDLYYNEQSEFFNI